MASNEASHERIARQASRWQPTLGRAPILTTRAFGGHTLLAMTHLRDRRVPRAPARCLQGWVPRQDGTSYRPCLGSHRYRHEYTYVPEELDGTPEGTSSVEVAANVDRVLGLEGQGGLALTPQWRGGALQLLGRVER